MEQWQIEAIAAVNAGREEFIRDIHIAADNYIKGINEGVKEDWEDLNPADVVQWLWESA